MKGVTLVTAHPKGRELLCTYRKANGKWYKIRRKDFMPYFYAPKRHDQKLSVFENINNLEKIICEHPAEVPKLREKHDKGFGFTYESDVLYDVRFFIDNSHEIDPEVKWNICWIDIEAKTKVNSKKCTIDEIKAGETEITAITRLDTLYKKITVYTTAKVNKNLIKDSILSHRVTELNKNNEMSEDEIRKRKLELIKELKGFVIEIKTFDSEFDMLVSFCKDLALMPPDVITAWNVHFDYVTIYNRCKKYGIHKMLSLFEGEEPFIKIEEIYDKNGNLTGKRYKYWTPGYYVMDYQEIYRKRNGKDEKSYALDYITRKWNVAIPKIHHDYGTDFDRFYEEDPNGFIYYNVVDTISIYLVDKKSGYMDISVMLCNKAHCPFVYCTTNRQIVDAYLISELNKQGLVRITPHDKNGESFSGAYVYAKKGFHKCYFSDLDFSCHPSDTKVITKEKGEINISEVKEGYHVYGIDGWHKVLKVHEYDYDDLLFGINGLYSTPKHKIPVVKYDTKKNKNGKIVRNRRQTDMASFWIHYTKEMYNENYNIICINKDSIKKCLEDSNANEIDILYGELIGTILAEGSLIRRDQKYFDKSRNKYRISHQCRIDITINKNEIDYRNRILYILKKLYNYTPYVYEYSNKNACHIVISKKDIYLDIVNKMNNIETVNGLGIIRGFFEGDGHVNKTRNSLVLTQCLANKHKINILCKLLDAYDIKYKRYDNIKNHRGDKICVIEISNRDALIKYKEFVGFISNKKQEDLNYIISKKKNMYKLDENTTTYETKIKETDIRPYKGKVYDLTLEGRPYYFANGILTHNSMYPSIMISLNISPETYVPQDELKPGQEYITSPVNTHFRKDIKGIVPQLLEKLFMERKEDKKTALKYKVKWEETGDEEYYKKFVYYWNKQLAEKTILNSFYGVLGDPKYALYKKEIAYTVTATGQYLIKYATEKLKEAGYEVLYTDTDSCYVKLKEHDYKNFSLENEFETIVECVEEIEKIYRYINSTFDELKDAWNLDEHRFEMKTEFLGRNIFIVEKKMYAFSELLGEKNLEDLRNMNSLEMKRRYLESLNLQPKDITIKGMPIVKSIMPDIIAKYCQKILQDLIHGNINEDMFVKIMKILWDKKIVPKAKKDPRLIAKTIKKNKVPVNKDVEWLAIERYNETHPIKIELGEKVYFIRTLTPERGVVWKMNEEPPKVPIDFAAMYTATFENIEKQFIETIEATQRNKRC